MSLFGALSAALTSLTAQSRAVNVISNNIANLSTTGFKGTSVSFATLVAGTIGGGVIDSLRADISEQGAVNSTGVGTDLAIQGNGFFPVKNASGDLLYTRAGSYRTDALGQLVNEAGYILQAWPLDSSGDLPTILGTSTLVPISTRDISNTASPTSSIAAKMNLNADQTIIDGAGDDINLQSAANSSNNGTDIIVPFGTMVNGNTFNVINTLGGTTSYTYGGIEASANISGGISNATTVTQTFTSASGGFADGDSFTIQSTSMTSPATFTFQTSSNTSLSEFKNLTELAQVIDATDGLRARVSGGVLYVAPDDANDALDFVNSGGNTTANMISTLGLADTATGTDRFASLGDLETVINAGTATTGVQATLSNPTATASLRVFNVDPTDDIQFTDSNAGDDVLDEFGLNSTAITNTYDPTSQAHNMASGTITPAFSKPITIFDSEGSAHTLTLAFSKIASSDDNAVWAVELFAADGAAELEAGSGLDSGSLIAYGNITFFGNGKIKSIDSSLSSSISFNPAGDASSQTFTLGLGTVGHSDDGLSQFGGDFTLTSLDQDGFPTGRLQSLQIDSQGTVTAIFDNNLTSAKYRIPLAAFPNPNGLTAEAGNAYSVNTTAGEVSLSAVGSPNVGAIIPGALELSTADIGNELTKLLVSQQSYSASANVLSKVNELFQDLKNI